jgi:phosphatidylglycerophosphatase A
MNPDSPRHPCAPGRRLAVLLATGFGLGLSPVASGTVGSLLGVLIAGATVSLSVLGQAAVAVVLAVIAIPICGIAERHFGQKDDRRIVADEYLTFPLCLIGINWVLHPWLLGVAFVTNRLLDIVKPPPARQIQQLKGGLGVVLDDVFSSLYALAANHAIALIVRTYVGG